MVRVARCNASTEGGSLTEDEIGFELDQLGSVALDRAVIASAGAQLDLQVAASYPTGLRERIEECRDIALPVRGIRHQHADPSHPLGLLCPRR
jgi:hypothetical protein